MLADHRWMDDQLDRLTCAFEADDPSLIAAIWGPFESFLLAHMEAEERLLYPELARSSPESVQSLVSDHAEIRERIAALGVTLELHTARVTLATTLAQLLRNHARCEDVLLFGATDARADASSPGSLLASGG